MFWKRKSKSPRDTADVLAGLPHDPEVLREMQRVLQVEKMNDWLSEMQAEKVRSRRVGTIFRFGVLAAIFAGVANTAFLIHTLKTNSSQSERSDAHIAVVDVESQIQAQGPASASNIIAGVRKALENDAVTAVVLNINSPGGSPTESQRVFHALRDLRERYDTPIVSWIGDIGASGAYYIAAGSEAIYASPSSIVGSIGVISASFGYTGAMDMLGIERRVFTAGDNKAFLDPFTPLASEQQELWESVLASTHQQFIADVMEGRGQALEGATPGDMRFSGAVWSGEQAVEVGLVDETMMLEALFQRLQPSDDGFPSVHRYTVKGSTMDRLIRRLPGAVAETLVSLSESNTQPIRF